MGTVIKFIIFVLIVYFFINVYKVVKGLLRSGAVLGGRTSPFSKGELCPSCQERINVPEEPGSCPKCNTPLGRSPDGKLLIKVN